MAETRTRIRRPCGDGANVEPSDYRPDEIADWLESEAACGSRLTISAGLARWLALVVRDTVVPRAPR